MEIITKEQLIKLIKISFPENIEFSIEMLDGGKGGFDLGDPRCGSIYPPITHPIKRVESKKELTELRLKYRPIN